MKAKYLIGVDIGTQGTKATLFDLMGNILAESFESSRLLSASPGRVEQEPEEIYFSVLHTFRDIMEKSNVCKNDIAAIGLDGQMAGILGIDTQWKAVTPYDSWLDTRCEKYIPFMKEKAEEELIRTTGCPVTYAHGPKILWWKYEKPEIYKKISKFVLPTTYVAGRMCGLKSEQAYIDYTHLHFSGFGDVQTNQWSQHLLRLFDVDRDKMPEIVEPWKVVGEVTPEAAEHSGLMAGIPVVAGCGDQAATSLGAGVVEPELVFDVAGTASVFSCSVDTYRPDLKYRTLLFPRSVIPGLWIPLAYINGGGLCIRWFKENLTGDKQTSYAKLDEEASRISAGSDGLVFLPHWGGRVCPNHPGVRGTWIGLNWNHTRAHLYRAVMEGIGYEYGHYLNIIRELLGDVSFTQTIAVGGGAKSSVFNKIKADILGVAYRSLSQTDTATFGSAVVAGYGAGVFGDMKSVVQKKLEDRNRIEPDRIKHHTYQQYIGIYEGLFETLEATHAKLALARVSVNAG